MSSLVSRGLLLRALLVGLLLAGAQLALHGAAHSSTEVLLALLSVVPAAWVALALADTLWAAAAPRLASSVQPLELSIARTLMAGLALASALAVLSAGHTLLEHASAGHHGAAPAEHQAMSIVEHSLRDGAALLPAAVAALLLVEALPAMLRGLRRRAAALGAASLRASAVLGLLSGMVVVTGAAIPAQAAAPAAPTCDAGSAVRAYDVAAVSVFIPYSRWINDSGVPQNGPDGTPHMTDGDPHGMAFVLQRDKAAMLNWYRPLVGTPQNGYAGDPADGRRLRPRPLALRANVGECIQIRLTNEFNPNAIGPFLPQVDPRVSLHAFGVSYDPTTGDGSAVGYNPDTTVGLGESITYYWRAPASEGMYLFRDMGMPIGADADGGAAEHGLFGGLAVEPAGSRWFDPVSGAELSSTNPAAQYAAVGGQSGDLYLNAVVALPNGKRFREALQISQDVIPVVPAVAAPGAPPIEAPERFSFNYGSEPEYKRDDFKNDPGNAWCPDCVGEETSLSSWVYGDPSLVKLASGPGPWEPEKPDFGAVDPASVPAGVVAGNVEDCGLRLTNAPDESRMHSCFTANVVRAYQGDPIKIRFGHAGVFETHVFHLHAHTWAAEPDDQGPAGSTPPQPSPDRQPRATTVDSQTYGPWTAFTANLNYGAGARVGTVGDAIFHCHLYPHFAAGFWALLRVHDTYETGQGANPDGLRVDSLVALRDITATGLDAPDSTVPPVKNEPSASVPGYPRFIPGEYGWRAPQPVNGIWQREFDADGGVVMQNGAPKDALAVRRVADRALDPALLTATQAVVVPDGTTPFTLAFAFAGETTAELEGDSSAAEVEAALEALDAITAATVSGSGTEADPWVVRLDQWRATADLTISASAPATVTPSAGFTPSDPDVARTAHSLAVEQISTRTYHDPSYQPGAAPKTGKAPRPGAPVVDPCPEGARTVTYRATVIQLPIVYNDADWVDVQGRIMVADEDVDAILAGTKAPEPFFFRVNAGDCIDFELTNRTPNHIGNDVYQQLVQTNMVGGHIHLVNFDVLASDGSSNGWNYQQAAFTQDQAALDRAVMAGERECSAAAGCTVALPTDYDPAAQSRNARANWLKNGQTIKERWFADYELRTVFMHDHHFAAIMQNRGMFNALVVEPAGFDSRDPATGQWLQPLNRARGGQSACVDACVGTAHGAAIDIVGPSAGDDYREFGVAVHDFIPLIIPPGRLGDLTLADIQSKANAIAPPPAPSPLPEHDQGGTAINYRNEPMKLRQFPAGAAPTLGNQVDPAYTFSSRVWGDPATPVLHAYRGDNVKVRLIQGSHEEQHNFTIHGTRWRRDAEDPASQYINTRAIGVSEAFNIDAKGISCGTGPNGVCAAAQPGQPLVTDYFYGTTGVEDLWAGAWGVMRVFDQTTASGVGGAGVLPPLPDNDAARPAGIALPAAGVQNLTIPRRGTTADGTLPKAASTDTCPVNAPIKTFSVSVINVPITYNRYGDNDPYGLAYVLTSDVGRIRNGQKALEPLVLRANESDCVVVNLTNSVDWTAFAVHGNQGTLDGDASMPLEPVPAALLEPGDVAVAGPPWFAGKRVSMHPSLVRYDVRSSDGATIGYNLDQTAGPGETVSYRWSADEVAYNDGSNPDELTDGELSVTPLSDFGDVRGHRHHGLLAALVVGPKGATFHDQITGLEVSTGAAVDVHVPGIAEDYRDVVVMHHNGLNLRNGGVPIPDPIAVDWPDKGERAISYKNAPLHRRLGLAQPLSRVDAAPRGAPFDGATFGRDLANVFSTRYQIGGRAIGDPDTPIIRAYVGDAVRMHVVQASDRARMIETEVSGHSWLEHAFDAGSVRAGVQGSSATGSAFSFHLRAAGGDMQKIGDFRYGVVHGVTGMSAGSWGILRVYAKPPAGQERNLTPLAQAQNPYNGGHPLQVLDLGAATPVVSLSSTQDWAVIQSPPITHPVTATVRRADGQLLANELVTFSWDSTVVTATTDGNGRATVQVPVSAPARLLTITAGAAGAVNASFVLEILARETTAPRVTAVTPANGATGIDPTSPVRVTFSERVNPATVTSSAFTLRVGTSSGALVPATVSVAADRLSATLVPSSQLASDTVYAVAVGSGVTDLVGNPLTAFASTFRVRDSTPPPAPTGLRATAGISRVDLAWTAVSAADLAGYIVTVDGVRVTPTPITGTTYSARNLLRGRTYTFGVAAIDRSGNISPFTTVTGVPR